MTRCDVQGTGAIELYFYDELGPERARLGRASPARVPRVRARARGAAHHPRGACLASGRVGSRIRRLVSIHGAARRGDRRGAGGERRDAAPGARVRRRISRWPRCSRSRPSASPSRCGRVRVPQSPAAAAIAQMGTDAVPAQRREPSRGLRGAQRRAFRAIEAGGARARHEGSPPRSARRTGRTSAGSRHSLLNDTRMYRLAAEDRGLADIAGVMRDLEARAAADVADRRQGPVRAATASALHPEARSSREDGRGGRASGRPRAAYEGNMTKRLSLVLTLAALAAPHAVMAKPAESKRMERAKDLIADEQWVRAIDEFKAAGGRSEGAEQGRSAVLARAQREPGARLPRPRSETISRLEREFPTSRWVKPARSLRIEIAQRLQRSDVLWWYAVAPAPPALPATARSAGPSPTPAPPPGAPPVPMPVAPTPPPAARHGRRRPRPRCRRRPPTAWVPEGFLPDTDLRIQALVEPDADRCAEGDPDAARDRARRGDAGEARRALFVLAQSGRADARSTVVEVAKTGPEPVRIAAVRELGRLGGPAVATELLQVYSSGDERVKYQVVTSLGAARRGAGAAAHRGIGEGSRGCATSRS